MLGQILITLLVILLAVVYLRRRARAEREAGSRGRLSQEHSSTNPWQGKARAGTGLPATNQPLNTPDYRLLLGIVLGAALVMGATLYYFSWQDSRATVTVILHRDNSNPPVIYEVRKRDLGERSFVTVDGTQVRVSANERMEIIGL